ncbi:transcriptional regulator, TetR family [Streptomyces sp. SceaMP-e96]|uniref:TetR/AcrR family transcriptional regulator n=1 Tax=Streptomyces TaxID=1883 RepID=UPI0008237D7B|nr:MULTISPECIES: TetR family transcriptional regulator [unclassified Streptomyces]MYT13977.1 TetR family transcriptional regulator [Streptomyces sp. SID4951]SCK56511.1 transcriptional regulator, TetR family [Streptomyces sp. SceaMP-e96]
MPTAPRTTPPPRPSLTERRKAETQLEIARTAAALFAERGAAVTADEIARTSGVALRTFYRYFRTKEDAVVPLLASGVREWIDDLATPPAGQDALPVREALERAARRALTPADEPAAEALRWTRGLLRAMPGDPALRAAWHRVHHDSEEALRPVLARLTGADPLTARLAAAAANTAMRVAVEEWAAGDAAPDGPQGPAELVVRTLRALTAGLPELDGATG